MEPVFFEKEFENKNLINHIVFICDHASNVVPESIAKGSLGLDKPEMKRHIAFDIGAKNLAVELGNILKAPVICSNFSRLVIDPNRGEKDPTLIMQLYDGTIIPANKNIEKTEILRRLNLFYRPYHDAIEQVLAPLENPIVVSIHSFCMDFSPPEGIREGAPILGRTGGRVNQPIVRSRPANKSKQLI